jgi:hypothetical protein
MTSLYDREAGVPDPNSRVRRDDSVREDDLPEAARTFDRLMHAARIFVGLVELADNPTAVRFLRHKKRGCVSGATPLPENRSPFS